MKNIEHAPDTLPQLTDGQSRKIKRHSVKPDSEPDTSDIPELSDAQLADTKRGVFYRLWDMRDRPCV